MAYEALREQAELVVNSAQAQDSLPNEPLIDKIGTPAHVFKQVLASLNLEHMRTVVPRIRELRIAILILEYLLHTKSGIGDQIPESEALKIWDFVSTVCLPPREFSRTSASREGDDGPLSLEDIDQYKLLTLRGISCLRLLARFSTKPSVNSLSRAFRFLASFADVRDPWTSVATNQSSAVLLEEVIYRNPEIHKATKALFELDILPAFSRSRSHISFDSNLQSGVNRRDLSLNEHSELEAKWKHDNFYLPTVLACALRRSELMNISFLHYHWPTIARPILILIDDPDIVYKVKGCTCVRLLLHLESAIMLERSGLGAVLENSLVTCLLYSTDSTGGDDDVWLLDVASDALTSLASRRFSTEMERTSRAEALGRILTHFLSKGRVLAGDKIPLMTLLTDRICRMTLELGVDILRHIKDIVDFLGKNLVNPFAASSPALLTSTLRALRHLILNTWPRSTHYARENMRALTICRTNLLTEDRASPGIQGLLDETQSLLQLLHGLTNISTFG